MLQFCLLMQDTTGVCFSCTGQFPELGLFGFFITCFVRILKRKHAKSTFKCYFITLDLFPSVYFNYYI